MEHLAAGTERIVGAHDDVALASVTARLRAAGCVFAEEEAELLLDDAGSDAEFLEARVRRRVAGEPLEQVLGWVGFAGRRWAVAPGVFVPRQRSELLVGEAVRAVARAWSEPLATVTVADLCCGNGALGGAVALALRELGADVALHAADVDPAATACAAANLGSLGGLVHTGDLFAAVPASLRGAVDLLICHAPYVPTAAIPLLPPEAREHEPLSALDGGPDGLDILRRVIADAPGWLSPGGTLLFELGDDVQIDEARHLLAAAHLAVTVTEDEESAAIIMTGRRGRGPEA